MAISTQTEAKKNSAQKNSAQKTESQPEIQVEAFVEGALVAVPGIKISQYKTWLSVWLAEMNPGFSPSTPMKLACVSTTDLEIQQINTDYRQQAKPTDVLSFAALETDLPGANEINQQQPLYLGDIIISVETAQRQASEENRTLSQESPGFRLMDCYTCWVGDHPDEQRLLEMLDKQTPVACVNRILTH